jgi:release factor glutamine methyltransferase
VGDTSAAVIDAVTAGALVANLTERLRASPTPSPRLDAELLVGHAFGRDRAWLHAHPEAELAAAEAAAVAGWAERRAAGEPIAYIRGFKEWLSVRLATDRRALIPRPETELLAEAAVSEIAARLAGGEAAVRAWEVGTGSGAVALALALRFRSAIALGRVELTASDLSADALELASENLHANGLGSHVRLACGDLLEPAVVSGTRPDVLIANLPYLTSAEVVAGIGSLAWEPGVALDGGPDGLDLLHRLVAALPSGLARGGTALLEVGEGQAEPVRRDMADLAPDARVTTLRDLAGIERVVTATLPAEEGQAHA